MIRQEQSSTWPLWCILGCFAALGATSSPALGWTAQSQGAGETSDQRADHEDQTAASSGSEPVPSATKVSRSSPGPEILLPTGSALSGNRTPQTESGRQPGESGGKPAGRTGDRDTQRSQAGTRATLAPRIAPHEEVCRRWPEGGAAIKPLPPLLAHTPSPVGPRPRRATLPSGAFTYPDTRLLPLEMTSPRRADQDVVATGEMLWAEPEALLERLDELAAERATGEWATGAAGLVRKLGPAVWQGSEEAISIVRQLQQLASQATPLSATVGDKPLARKLCRAGHALSRRLDVWEQIVQLGSRRAITAEVFQPDPGQLSLCLVEMDAITGDSAQGRAWREYLLLDALREWSARGGPPEDRLPRTLAQRVLKRLSRVPMSLEQRQFVSSSPVAAFQESRSVWQNCLSTWSGTRKAGWPATPDCWPRIACTWDFCRVASDADWQSGWRPTTATPTSA